MSMMVLISKRRVTTLREQKPEIEAHRNFELIKIESTLKENGVLVSSLQDIEGLSSRGYGVSENGNLLLTFYEALFLLSKGIIEIKDEKTGKEVSFQDLLQCFQSVDENAWVKYMVYRDLRSRGYVAREGFGLGIDFSTPTVLSGLAITDVTTSRLVRMKSKKNFFISYPCCPYFILEQIKIFLYNYLEILKTIGI